MKMFQLDINQSQIKTFFPHERIKNKYKILEILLEACRYILYNKRVVKSQNQYRIILYKEKTSRLIFIGENKIYSIVFPFNITQITSEEIKINYRNILEIDSENITKPTEITNYK